MKIIIIAGEPGSGKSSIMKNILTPDMEPFHRGLVRGHANAHMLILGTYADGETYPGTDRLSMAVQPPVIDLLKSDLEYQTIMFEGDRLCNFSLLQKLKDMGHEVLIFVLSVEENVLEERRRARKDTFNATWLKGRKSKVLSFQREAERLFGVNYLKNDTYPEFVLNLERVSAAARTNI